MMMRVPRCGEERTAPDIAMPLTSLERALLRLLVSGCPLEEAAPSLGLPMPEAERLLSDFNPAAAFPASPACSSSPS